MYLSPPTPFRRPLTAGFALLFAAILAAGQEGSPTTPEDLLQRAVDDGTTPGAALLVIDGGTTRQELYLGRFHPDLVLPFEGATSWLSTVTVLTLIDDGVVDLEDPLIKFFPDLEGAKAAMTLRQVLSHTGGLPSSHPCLGEPSASLESCAEAILEAPLVGTPGREFLFGGAGLQVAGRISEIASGTSWSAVFRRKLAEPLGLQRTSYGSSTNPNLAAGARGTVGDYGRFLASLLPPRAGARPLLSPVLAVAMLTDQSAGTRRAYWPVDGAWGFGLGTWLTGDEITPGGSEGPGWATSPGHLGFTPWLLRDRDLAAVLVISGRPAEVAEVRRSLPPSALLGLDLRPAP